MQKELLVATSAIVAIISLFFMTIYFHLLSPPWLLTLIILWCIVWLKFDSLRLVNTLINRNIFEFLLITGFLYFFVLFRAGSFDLNLISLVDYPLHFYRTWLVSDVLLPNFGNIIGWVPFFQGGYIELFDNQPGPPLLVALLRFLTVGQFPLPTLFRFTVIMGFLLVPLSIFFFCKSLKIQNSTSLLAALFWLFWSHHYFEFGLYSLYYALAFSLFALAFYHAFLNNRSLRNLLLTDVFLSLSFLFHPTIFLFSLVFLAIWSFSKLGQKSLKPAFILAILFLGLSAVYLAEIYEGSVYSSISWSEHLNEMFPGMFNFKTRLLDELLATPIVPFLAMMSILLILFEKEKIPQLKPLAVPTILLLLLSILTIFLQKTFGSPWLNIFKIERFSAFIHVFAIILACLVLQHIMAKTPRKYRFVPAFSLALVLVTFAFFFLYLTMSWYNPSDLFDAVNTNPPASYKNVFLSWYRVLPMNGIFSFNPDGYVYSTFFWLRHNTIQGSRIVFEDSSKNRYGGWLLALAPFYTNREFIGGPFPSIKLSKELDVTAINGQFFGKSIGSYRLPEFRTLLEDFDIKYLTVWSPSFIDYLSKQSNEFPLAYVSPKSDIFVFLNPTYTPARVRSLTGNSSAIVTSTSPTLIAIDIQNATKDEEILVKLRQAPNWKATSSAGPIEKTTYRSVLTKLTLPAAGNYKINLRFEESLLEKAGKWISIISIISAIVIYLAAGNRKLSL